MKYLYIIIITLAFLSTSAAQQKLEKKLSGEYNPLELISISSSVTFDQAIKMLSGVSLQVTGKTIVSSVPSDDPIDVEIRRLPFMDALNVIVNLRNLMYEETENMIVVKQKPKAGENAVSKKQDNDTYAEFEEREVNISAVFFEADIERSKDVGIDWKWLLQNGGATIGAELRTKSQIDPTSGNGNLEKVLQPEANLNTASSLDIGRWTGNVTAMFRFFESQNLGEIIASPSITVRDRQKGRIQIGSDFSIKQRDFSGNIIDRFYSAGSIIEVTPYVHNKNGVDYILLKLSVERSSFFPSELTTEVKKTAAASDVLLLDGEETVIGGLYINEENIVRNGIPFLKDLPWWVLGIRYLTGSDQTVVRKKEVVILLKAELLQTLEERNNKVQSTNLIEEKIKKDNKEIEFRKFDFLKEER